jgi:hypothetical protein
VGWEYRGPYGPYYTRTVRTDGGFRRIYFGRGDGARLAAEADALEKARREEESLAAREERERLTLPEAVLDELDSGCRLMTDAVLLAEGFTRHGRGSWRRRRGARHGR